MITRNDVSVAIDVHRIVSRICTAAESHEEYALKCDMRAAEDLGETIEVLVMIWLKARGLTVD